MSIKIKNMQTLWKPFTPNKAFNKDPVFFTSSDGMYYTDDKGNKILDGTSGLWCCNLGYNNQKIVESISKQAQSMYYSPSFNIAHPLEYELAAQLTKITPKHLNHVFLTNSGSESVESALKMALLYQRSIGEGTRTLIIGRHSAYHGVNFGGTSAGGLLGVKEMYNNLIKTVHLPSILDMKKNAFSKGMPKYGKEKADDLLEMINTYGAKNIAALILEPVGGSCGVHVPPVGYLERIQKICQENGILLIFDEVITGFGRLGVAFGADRFAITPDIITLAKGLSNGAIAMGAVVASDKVYDGIINNASKPVEFPHGYTYSGHPMACAAAIATLKVYEEEKMFDKVDKMQDFFQEEIHTLKKHKSIIDIRNIGLMGGIEFNLEAQEVFAIFKQCLKNNVLVRSNMKTIALSPPYIVSKEEIKTIIKTLSNAISVIENKV